ncbi:PREDICTED: lysine-rich nucleolar protein 1 [Charadrius vociferus]|uniref:lysine-rich nucleolar protein 1 n=1 Tax=Charadrius vociferus TaxID=50402 RepID=UPI000521657B|nr:PREDICTED: lysine-rich nucleolar protein 1 [Charadrius vociferus]
MIIKKKRQEVHAEHIREKKKVKSGRSHTIIKIEEDVQTVIKTEDDGQLETKTKVKKKENLKEDDDCLDKLELKKKKKKNKKKKVDSELLEEAHSESFANDIQDSEHKQSEKVHKKRHKYISQEKAFTGDNQRTDIIQNDGESYVRRKKRKKKKDKSNSFLPLADTQDNICGVPDSPIPLTDFSKRQRKNFQETAFTNREEEDTTENSGNIRETKRKKKRCKDVSSLTREDDQDSSHRAPDKHLPAQQEASKREDVDDVTIVQEKKGNCDEINIDKVRRQALQEEIDRASGKTKVFSPKVEQDTKFGQWSTAAFRSSEEEMKFFRLMGGFKKGSVPIQNPSATTNKPNMALNREGQEKLQQALKMEFDKAMDLKQHRGIGLGFQPAANKKVYIDKYTTRSIKFED